MCFMWHRYSLITFTPSSPRLLFLGKPIGDMKAGNRQAGRKKELVNDRKEQKCILHEVESQRLKLGDLDELIEEHFYSSALYLIVTKQVQVRK